MMLSLNPAGFAHAAQPAETLADVQCLVVGSRLAASPDQRVKLSGMMLAIYFLGRIDGRSPTVDLQGLMVQQVKKMSVADLKNAAVRCGAVLSSRGAEITKIGQNVERLGTAQQGR